MRYELITKDLILILLGTSIGAVLFFIFILVRFYLFMEQELKPLVKKIDTATADFNRIIKGVEESINQILGTLGRRKEDKEESGKRTS